MRAIVDCDSYSVKDIDSVPYIESSVIYNEEQKRITVFASNRSLDEDAELDIALEGFGKFKLSEWVELYCDDLKAENSADGEIVSPTQRAVGDPLILKKHSWNMLVFDLE